jgi:hypothetical protein
MVLFYIGVDSIGHCRLPTTSHATLRLTICLSAAGTIRRSGFTVTSASTRFCSVLVIRLSNPGSRREPECHLSLGISQTSYIHISKLKFLTAYGERSTAVSHISCARRSPPPPVDVVAPIRQRLHRRITRLLYTYRINQNSAATDRDLGGCRRLLMLAVHEGGCADRSP